jgi:hypothetical protein
MAALLTFGMIAAGYGGYAGWPWWLAAALGGGFGLLFYSVRSAPALAGVGAGAHIYSVAMSVAIYVALFCGLHFLVGAVAG